MGRRPCCDKEGLNRGAWTAEEDRILVDYMKAHSKGRWENIPKKAGLNRCGKSCRFRWLNYLRPDIKRGNISPDEEELIIRLHKLLGNRWSLIAGRLPGRTDNEIKNYWNTILGKRAQDDEKQKLGVPMDRHYPKQPGGKTELELQESDTTGNPHSTDKSSEREEETVGSLAAFWAATLERSEVAMKTQVSSSEQARRHNHGFGIQNSELESVGATPGLSSGFYHGGDVVENAAMDFDFGNFCRSSDLLNSELSVGSNLSSLPSLDPQPASFFDEPMVQNRNMITNYSHEAGNTVPNYITQSLSSLKPFDSPEEEWL